MSLEHYLFATVGLTFPFFPGAFNNTGILPTTCLESKGGKYRTENWNAKNDKGKKQVLLDVLTFLFQHSASLLASICVLRRPRKGWKCRVMAMD